MPKEKILEEEKKMSIDNVTLTAAMRQNVLSLQNTQTHMNSTETALSTGKSVNTALDNPIAYFAAQSYTDRANDLSNLKDSMNTAIQSVTAANNGITGIEDLVAQAPVHCQLGPGYYRHDFIRRLPKTV